MKRLQLLQDALVDSGLLDRDQITLHNFTVRPMLAEDEDDFRYIVERDVFIYIKNFLGDVDLLGLIAKLAVKKLWPAPCQAANVESIETDPLDSEESMIVITLTVNDVYHLKPMGDTQGTENVIIEHDNINYQLIDEMPVEELPDFARIQRL